MAAGDVWGNRWLATWGVSWKQAATATPSAQPTPTLGGSRFDRRKPKQRVIRYSDFETREAYAQAIAQAAMPMAQLPPVDAPADEWEDAEDAMIAFALIRMLH